MREGDQMSAAADIDPRVMAEAFFGLTSSYVIMRRVLGLGEGSVDV